MRDRKIFTFAFIIIVLSSFISCKYDLIEAPSREGNVIKNPADYPDSILPPENLYATQGGFRNIKLNWDKVENAVQYYIYSADSPFDTFTQIAETTASETEILLEEKSGVSQYYAVSAINYYGTISSKSKTISGSTLAVPFITDIESEDEGTALKITWWMDNASEDTYENNLQYKIFVYDSEKKEIENLETYNIDHENNKIIYENNTIPGNERSVTVANLSAKTDYFFVIEAQFFSKDSEGEITILHSEKCDYTNASTAHSVIPLAPSDVIADQGKNTDFIYLSWNLPDAVDFYDSKAKSYVPHPIYFEVQRRLYKTPDQTPADDTGFETIKRIGVTGLETTIRGETKRNSPATIELMYNCTEGSTYYPDGTDASEVLSIIKTGDSTAIENYEQYIPGYKLSFKDDSATALRGEQYEYRVVSFADDMTQKRSNDNSKSETVVGWKVAFAEFHASSSYQIIEGTTQISRFEIKFLEGTNFNTFGISDYKYMIEERFVPENTTDVISNIIVTLDSIEEVKNYVKTINCNDIEVLGRYKYVLYINYSSTTTDDALLTIKSIGTVTVTDDTSKIPNLTTFEVQDGYKDKYVLYWNFDENYNYSVIKYTYSSIDDTNGIEESPVNLTNYTINGDLAYFDYIVHSGDISIFEIIATHKTAGTICSLLNDVKSFTLGTPDVTKLSNDYKSITVHWPSVQKATGGYIVSAHYKNDTVELINSTNNEITYNESLGIYTCIFTPEDFDNPLKSGKPIEFSVSAKNNETQDFSTTQLDVNLVGPAGINLIRKTDANGIILTRNKIQLNWDEVEGACGYIINRNKYSYNISKESFEYDSTDLFYYDLTGIKPTLKYKTYDVTDNEGVTILFENGIYSLIDEYKEPAAGALNYQLNQGEINWGIPYGYTIVPVSTGGTVEDFEIESSDKSVNVTGGEANFVYTAPLKEVKHATLGYSTYLTAKKSVSSTRQQLDWALPYYVTEDFSGKIYPSVYFREAGSINEWTKKELNFGKFNISAVLKHLKFI